VSLLVALLLFREIPFLVSPTRSLASESVVFDSLTSLAAGSDLEDSFAGVGEGLADSDLLVVFFAPFGGAVRGRDERGFMGDEDFLMFSFSFSSLFIDLGVEMAKASAERDSLLDACS